MLEESDKKKLTFSFQYRDGGGRLAGPVLNAWQEFRKYLHASLANTFWSDEDQVKKYAQVFEVCKGHLIGLADIVLTTNGNAQCSELVNYWADAYELYKGYGVKEATCLGVFIDEIGKEQEINVWNAILSKGLPRVPDFVMLLGDPK